MISRYLLALNVIICLIAPCAATVTIAQGPENLWVKNGSFIMAGFVNHEINNEIVHFTSHIIIYPAFASNNIDSVCLIISALDQENDSMKLFTGWRGRNEAIADAALSPEEFILAAVNYKGNIKAWDLSRNSLLYSFNTSSVYNDNILLRFTPGGDTLIMFNIAKNYNIRLNARTGTFYDSLKLPFTGPEVPGRLLRLSKDGRTVAIERDSGNVDITDVRTGAVLSSIKNPAAGSYLKAMTFSPHDNYMALVYSDSLYLYDIKNALLGKIDSFNYISLAGFSWDEKYLYYSRAVKDDDSHLDQAVLYAWSIDSKTASKLQSVLAQGYSYDAFDGSRFALIAGKNMECGDEMPIGGNSLIVYNATEPDFIKSFPSTHNSAFDKAIFSFDNKYIATTLKGEQTIIRYAANGNVTASTPLTGQLITFSDNGSLVYILNDRKLFYHFSLINRSFYITDLANITHDTTIYSMRCSYPYNKLIFETTDSIYVMNVESYSVSMSVEKPKDIVIMKFSNDWKSLIGKTANSDIWVLDITKPGSHYTNIDSSLKKAGRLADISSDLKYALFINDKTVTILDINGMKVVQTYDILKIERAPYRSVSFYFLPGNNAILFHGAGANTMSSNYRDDFSILKIGETDATCAFSTWGPADPTAVSFDGKNLVYGSCDGSISMTKLCDITDIDDEIKQPGSECNLELQPNPVKLSARVKFTAGSNGWYRIAVCNLLGNEVALIENQYLLAGNHEFVVNTDMLPAGAYFLVMKSIQKTSIKPFIIER